MLYDNYNNESVAFGGIKYIAEELDFKLNIPIKPNIKSVLNVLNKHDGLMLLEVVSKHSA